MTLVNYLNGSLSGLSTSAGEERTDFSAISYSWFCCFCSKEFPLPLGAMDRLCYFLWHSLDLPNNCFINELRREKTGFLHMRKQRPRSASR